MACATAALCQDRTIVDDWTITFGGLSGSYSADIEIYFFDEEDFVKVGCAECNTLRTGDKINLRLSQDIHDGNDGLYVGGLIYDSNNQLWGVVPLQERWNESTKNRSMQVEAIALSDYDIGMSEPLTLSDRQILEGSDFANRLQMIDAIIKLGLIRDIDDRNRVYGLLMATADRFEKYELPEMERILAVLLNAKGSDGLQDEFTFWRNYARFFAVLGTGPAADVKLYLEDSYITIGDFSRRALGRDVINQRPIDETSRITREILETMHADGLSDGKLGFQMCMSLSRRYFDEVGERFVDENVDEIFSTNLQIVRTTMRCSHNQYEIQNKLTADLTLADAVCLLENDTASVGRDLYLAMFDYFLLNKDDWNERVEDVGVERILRRGLEAEYLFLTFLGHSRIQAC